MKHRKIILILCFFLCIFLTSCIPTIQLNERALVQAVGIDLKENQYTLTFQIFSPTSGNGGNIGASSDNAKIIEASGKTVTQAIDNAGLTQGKKLFIGQNRIIIIGSDVAKQGISHILDYFNTTVGSRKNANVLIANGKASDILKAKINQGMLPAETLEKMVEKTSEDGTIEEMHLFELLRTLNNKHDSAFLPVIEIKKQQNEGQGQQGSSEDGSSKEKKESSKKEENIDEVSTISLESMAIVSNGKLTAILDKELSRGIMWIRNAIKNANLIVESDKYEYADIFIEKSKTKIVPHVENKKIHFDIFINSSAMLGEVKLKPNVTVSLKDLAQLEVASKKTIERECKNAFEKVILEYHSDVFYFGDLVWREDSDFWKEVRDNWQDNVDKITISVDATIKIDTIGLEFLTHT